MQMSDIVDHIVNRLTENESVLIKLWSESSPVKYFYIDELLPAAIVERASATFPPVSSMNRRSSIREKKFTSANMGLWGDETRNVFLALQSKPVMEAIERITGIEDL